MRWKVSETDKGDLPLIKYFKQDANQILHSMEGQTDPVRYLSSSRAPLIYVIGGPGSGKGTLCRLLAEEYNCYHISVGDLLRSLKDGSSSAYEDVSLHFEAGSLVPTCIVADVLQNAIAELAPGYRAILVDGFPRRGDQCISSGTRLAKPTHVLSFRCERAVAMHRFLLRRFEGKLKNGERTFLSRWARFRQMNNAVEEHYQDLGILSTIDANDAIEVSYAETVAALKWKKY